MDDSGGAMYFGESEDPGGDVPSPPIGLAADDVLLPEMGPFVGGAVEDMR